MPEPFKPYPPTAEELCAALRVAAYAQDVVDAIVVRGRPKAYDFSYLCHLLVELDHQLRSVSNTSQISRAERLRWRAEDIEDAEDGGGFLDIKSSAESQTEAESETETGA